mgnify:CR=1 FL=1
MTERVPLILALDVATPDSALGVLDEIGDALSHIKIGHQLYALGGLPSVRDVMRRGYRVFLDLKLHDIPNTVRMAVDVLAGEGLWALTLLSSGGRSMMRAARDVVDAKGVDMMLLGVTVLTSLDEGEWSEVHPGCPMSDALARRASCARDAGMHGIVCSPSDLPVVRAAAGYGIATVVPGVRFETGGDDQSRTGTPRETIAAGADYLVVGRPILGAADRNEMIAKIAQDIREGFSCRKRM